MRASISFMTRSWLAGMLLGAAAFAAVGWAAVTIPHIFQKDDPISASAFNENFQALAAAQGKVSGDLMVKLTGKFTVAQGVAEVTATSAMLTGELQPGDSIALGNHISTVVAVTDSTLTIEDPHPHGALDVDAYSDNPLLTVRTGAGKLKAMLSKSGVFTVKEIRLQDPSSSADNAFARITQSSDTFIDNGGGGTTYINYNTGSGLVVGGGDGSFGPITASEILGASSGRYKTEVTAVDYGLREINRLQGVRFRYTKDQSAKAHIGFLAEDVAKLIPEIVSNDEHGLAAAMDYSKLTVVLVNAVKELEAENKRLAQRISALESNRVGPP